jgi:hypothetical protein
LKCNNLILTGENYTKFDHPQNLTTQVRAKSTLIKKSEMQNEGVHVLLYLIEERGQMLANKSHSRREQYLHRANSVHGLLLVLTLIARQSYAARVERNQIIYTK